MTENKPDTGVGSDLKIPEKKFIQAAESAKSQIIQGSGDWTFGKYHDEKTPGPIANVEGSPQIIHEAVDAVGEGIKWVKRQITRKKENKGTSELEDKMSQAAGI